MVRVTVLLDEELNAWLEDSCRKASSKKSTYIASLVREQMEIHKAISAPGWVGFPTKELPSKRSSGGHVETSEVRRGSLTGMKPYVPPKYKKLEDK
jgi:hypothetical protein